LDQFSRIELLLDGTDLEKLKVATVAVFGLGGVGSFTAEALARSGVGGFLLVDDDLVCVTNINRQLIATHATVGRKKTDVMRERLLDINPRLRVETLPLFYGADTADQVCLDGLSYIVDAIDTVSAKLILVERAVARGISIISAMGAGNRLSSAGLTVTDISKTSVCPLARVMRKELRSRGIEHLKVVYTKEPFLTPKEQFHTSCKFNCVCPPGVERKCTDRRSIPGSAIFAPSIAGILLAEAVVHDLLARA
jgi:tRNA A37 threonylcarbamoyladenosine dehydratase